jgi:hypothetical protein
MSDHAALVALLTEWAGCTACSGCRRGHKCLHCRSKEALVAARIAALSPSPTASEGAQAIGEARKLCLSCNGNTVVKIAGGTMACSRCGQTGYEPAPAAVPDPTAREARGEGSEPHLDPTCPRCGITGILEGHRCVPEPSPAPGTSLMDRCAFGVHAFATDSERCYCGARGEAAPGTVDVEARCAHGVGVCPACERAEIDHLARETAHKLLMDLPEHADAYAYQQFEAVIREALTRVQGASPLMDADEVRRTIIEVDRAELINGLPKDGDIPERVRRVGDALREARVQGGKERV